MSIRRGETAVVTDGGGDGAVRWYAWCEECSWRSPNGGYVGEAAAGLRAKLHNDRLHPHEAQFRSYGHETSCDGKRRYPTKTEAKRAAKQHEQAIGRTKPYRCSHCAGWHIGHRPPAWDWGAT